MADLRTVMFEALTGRRGADVSGRAAGDVAGMLMAAFGPGHRDATRPDTASAAKALKVKQRTVQRWLKGTHPNPENLAHLVRRARQAATTKRGRAEAVKQVLTEARRTMGLRITMSGLQGLPDYLRKRTVSWDLDPSFAQDFTDAYINGGESAARSYLERNAPEIYGVPDWELSDMSNIEIDNVFGK